VKRNISQKLILLSFIALSGVGLIGYADYKTNQKLVDSGQWVQQTERVIYQSDNLYSLSKDIEIQTQGCLITNDSASLEPRIFPKTIFTYIGQLRRLTVDNPSQQQRIDSLTLYMFKYLNFSYQTVELRNSRGLIKAIAFIATKEGLHYTDRINSIIRNIQQEENSILTQRTLTNERSVAAFKLFSLGMLLLMGAIAVLLLVTASKFFLQTKEKELRAAELVIANKELIIQNDEKEKLAAEKVIAEEQIEFERNNLAALINNTDDMMWSLDADLRLITFNQAFNKDIELTTGKPPGKGENIFLFYVNENRLNAFKILYEKALKGESFTILDRLDYPADLWSEVSFYPLLNGDTVIGTACFSRDVTQRTKNERVLRVMESEISNQKIQEQKKIARAILNAQEKERNRIGQELHDNVSQILVSSKLYLSSVCEGNESLKELVKYPSELIDNSIQEIRLLSSRQVTPLKNVDLQDLVQSLLDRLRESTSIKTVFTYDIAERELTDDLKLNIYRIIQEQISNVVKYASAGKVNIAIEAKPAGLHIELKDDGTGFDLTSKRNGIGLSNMMNRIESFNGQMILESSPGKGCSIRIDIPFG
jgi:signal transduction histidine kinase/CHASE3 domain sensor protein